MKYRITLRNDEGKEKPRIENAEGILGAIMKAVESFDAIGYDIIKAEEVREPYAVYWNGRKVKAGKREEIAEIYNQGKTGKIENIKFFDNGIVITTKKGGNDGE